MGPTIISSGDPFGMFAFSKVIPGERTLLVLPYSVDLKAFPFPSGLLPGGKALRRRSLEVVPRGGGKRICLRGFFEPYSLADNCPPG